MLRGVHAHVRHWDYLTVPLGHAVVGLHDLRTDSPTDGPLDARRARGRCPVRPRHPPGVAHGFYFHEPSLHIYAVSHEWDPDDELGCRWDDPAARHPVALCRPAAARAGTRPWARSAS